MDMRAAQVVKNFAFEKFWSVVSSVAFSSIPTVASDNRYLINT